jgi:hypothetical protein
MPKSKVIAEKLEAAVYDCKNRLTAQQYARGLKVVKNIQEGAPSFQKKCLPPTDVPNSETCYVNGKYLTDTLATWIKNGIVAGPFSSPPCPGFRANSVAVIKKGAKIRPIINMSEPKGSSFNDNVNEKAVEKVWMATGQMFSYTFKEAGKNCVFSKFDLKDAFKNIPAKLTDRRYQGFRWLGKYFLETQMIFGASPSVANFDQLSNTLVEITTARAKIPRRLVNRTLDDITVVAPEGTKFAEDFGATFKKLCKNTNVLLAENCPKNEKAFELQKTGIVLGIGFNSEKQVWFLPKKKSEKIRAKILEELKKSHTSLHDWQKTMGLINNLSLMAPFLRFFKFSGNQMLGAFAGNEGIALKIPVHVKEDLIVCAKVAESALSGLPIASRPCPPPLHALQFYSDAAGSKYSLYKGNRVNHNDRGVASIQFEAEKAVWYCTYAWPLFLLNEALDKSGVHYGSKMVTLEMIGLLLPMLCMPERISGRDVVFHVDNIAVVYGWYNGATKLDEAASILLRGLHLMASFLGATVHVRHAPRRSCMKTTLADNLSRKSTTTAEDKKQLGGAECAILEGVLCAWLKNPTENWALAKSFLEETRVRVARLEKEAKKY